MYMTDGEEDRPLGDTKGKKGHDLNITRKTKCESAETLSTY
jgi:hypothetical protein